MKIISILALLTPLLVALGSAEEKPSTKPNILFILTDDMGWGDLGCYGSKQIPTPAIDKLAREGTRFTQAYVSANVCAPSRAGILTGRYQERFGFEHNLAEPDFVKTEKIGIPLDEKLISNRLKELGYRTGAIGKWHVGESIPEFHPMSRGFDFFFGMLGGGHHFFPTPENNKLLMGREKVTKIRTPYLTDWFTLEAIDFMTRESAKKQPWFLYLAYNTPHSPIQAKAEDIAAFPNVKEKQRRTYCAMQKCLDENIAKMVAHLKKINQLDNTLIIFLNDNGGSVEVSHAINAPLNGTKGTWLEGGIRVPFIMRWPGKVPANKVYNNPVISLDIMHTCVAIAGGKVEVPTFKKGRRTLTRPRDGVNLLPYINGENTSRPHQTLYWRMTLRGGVIREGDWKLIMTPHHPTMLFDLSKDVSEQHNLATSHPELVKKLFAKYHLWCESFERNPMWISDPFWAKYNRKLYDAHYQLTQP